MPIFIGGMYKTGTTLVRRYIGNHPKIFSGLESNWFELDNFFKKKNIDLTKIINTWEIFFDIKSSEIYEIILSSQSSEEVLDKLFNKLKNKKKLSEWCEKSPPNITYGGRIFNFWPKAKLIHIIRDPFDVFCSLKESKNEKDPKSFVKKWIKIFSEVKDLRKNKNYIEIRYEDIILNKDESLKKLFDFCNLDWEIEYGIHKRDSSEFKIVEKATGVKSTTLKRLMQPISKDRIGIHKEYLQASERKEIEILIEKGNLKKEFYRGLWKK